MIETTEIQNKVLRTLKEVLMWLQMVLILFS